MNSKSDRDIMNSDRDSMNSQSDRDSMNSQMCTKYHLYEETVVLNYQMKMTLVK